MLANQALSEQEARRLQEVRAAFFEGMLAGNDQLWMGRPPEDYWLESDTRRNLYAGPPLPLDPASRSRLARTRGGYSYNPQRDPARVVTRSFWGGSKKQRGKRTK